MVNQRRDVQQSDLPTGDHCKPKRQRCGQPRPQGLSPRLFPFLDRPEEDPQAGHDFPKYHEQGVDEAFPYDPTFPERNERDGVADASEEQRQEQVEQDRRDVALECGGESD